MRNLFKPAVYLTSAFLLLSGIACKEKPKQSADIAIPAVVIKVLKTDLPWVMEYPAQAAGSLEIQVRAQAGGILKARLYDEGSYVNQGEQMFQIDEQPYKVAMEKAQAALVQAQSNESRTRRDFERMQLLRPDNAISQKDYDDALSAYDVAKANVVAAQASVNDAQINLGYTKVAAPISGVSGEAAQSVGSLIAPSGESGLLTTMVQINPLYVNFSMPFEQFSKLARGIVQGTISVNDIAEHPITVEAILTDGSAYPYPGKIIYFSSSENSETASIAVKAALPNPDNERLLMPGQFVRVRIVGAMYKAAVVIPSSALLATPTGSIVYIVGEDNIVDPRPVKAVLSNGLYFISEGLKGGETIVSEGLIKIKPGEKLAPEFKAFTVNSSAQEPGPKAVGIPAIGGSPASGAPAGLVITKVEKSAIPLVSAGTEEIIPGTEISKENPAQK